MKRTDMLVLCGERANGTLIYRTVVTDGKRYFVRWNGKLVDVTKKIENRDYLRKRK